MNFPLIRYKNVSTNPINEILFLLTTLLLKFYESDYCLNYKIHLSTLGLLKLVAPKTVLLKAIASLPLPSIYHCMYPKNLLCDWRQPLIDKRITVMLVWFQEWYVNLNKPSDKDASTASSATKMQQEEANNNNNCCNSSRSDAEDFVTASSDCTGTPPSRSSSYHTPSEGEATSNSPWWELDTTVDAETTADSSKCLQLTDESQQVSDTCNVMQCARSDRMMEYLCRGRKQKLYLASKRLILNSLTPELWTIV